MQHTQKPRPRHKHHGKHTNEAPQRVYKWRIKSGRSFGSFSKNISNQQTPWVFHLQKKCSDLVRPFSGNMHLTVAVSLSIKEHPSTGLETLGLEVNEGSQAQKTLYRTCEINILLIRT